MTNPFKHKDLLPIGQMLTNMGYDDLAVSYAMNAIYQHERIPEILKELNTVRLRNHKLVAMLGRCSMYIQNNAALRDQVTAMLAEEDRE